MRPLLFIALLQATLSLATAQSNLDHVRRAQALLGDHTWSQVLMIENKKPVPYLPSRVHALVFEFNAILWIYLPQQGTQSLSTHLGRLEQDRRDLLPLLQALHPGLVRFTVLPDDVSAKPGLSGSPRNGCFIESLATARIRMARGERLLGAGILLVYAKSGGSNWGHAVLAYETPQGVVVEDPQRKRSTEVKGSLQGNPLQLARMHLPRLKSSLVSARLVPVPLSPSPIQLAAAP